MKDLIEKYLNGAYLLPVIEAKKVNDWLSSYPNLRAKNRFQTDKMFDDYVDRKNLDSIYVWVWAEKGQVYGWD